METTQTILTLTSDLGLKDHYVASVKASILRRIPSVQIIDVSHDITPYNIQEAAFTLRNAYPHFPAGSIHLAGVLEEPGRNDRQLLIQHEEHYFIGRDNGLFSLVFDGYPEHIFTVLKEEGPPETLFGDLVETACRLLQGHTPEEIGQRISHMESRVLIHPPESDSLLRVNVVHIDHFGNVVLNLLKDRFEQIRRGRRFNISIKRNERISRISNSYSDVVPGELLCLFNYSNYLEIAINQGKASQLLGLKLGDIIQIEFL